MGILPQLRPSAAKVSSDRRSQQPVKHATTLRLFSTETQRIKAAVLAAHADAQPFVRFSFSRMRHKATPPVQIPTQMADPRALRTFVAGRKVPFTRAMHANLQKKAKKRGLDVIGEYVQY
ncbi:hypothetical protein PybrP1_012645 [[Pythium] brassicae (nom. inval.)]|nr:hypothetical protein PybrP1_012645 [[Pythium] brassicae (nom. inval.)]